MLELASVCGKSWIRHSSVPVMEQVCMKASVPLPQVYYVSQCLKMRPRTWSMPFHFCIVIEHNLALQNFFLKKNINYCICQTLNEKCMSTQDRYFQNMLLERITKQISSEEKSIRLCETLPYHPE